MTRFAAAQRPPRLAPHDLALPLQPITYLNATWVVPSDPATSIGSNAPGWWYGVQTSKGNGALVQPILAYGYTERDAYAIFNACFDWTDGSWTTSKETYDVKPGDTITSSVTFNPSANSYTMYIKSADTGKSITTDYKLKPGQSLPESTAYFVLEHQPRSCKAYPTDGELTFSGINLQAGGKTLSPQWVAKQERPACDSEAKVIDAQTLKFTWNAASASLGEPAHPAGLGATWTPPKWGSGPMRPPPLEQTQRV
jgi:hypothetical protein